ncbi:general transcription factor IIH subunit 3-like [Drosophila pseudoobscura]|uniref:General transcription factor IIH subunit 3 n=1 Tax=Drosophila pseudoobscura pseudoobscura TaxID=46245 RepID=B5DLH0_DROPS|nr:general transcription factor IIH subunit 3 [Drosophila pseudoobscura]
MEAQRYNTTNVSIKKMESSKTEAEITKSNENRGNQMSTAGMDANRRFFKMRTSLLDSEDVHILVLILDIDYGQSYIQPGKVDMVLNVVDASMVLANGHLLERPHNEVGIIACSRSIVMLAHSIDEPLTTYDFQLDTIKTMEYAVSTKVETELKREFSIEKLNEDKKSSLLAESLGLALCYIQKRRRQIPNTSHGRSVQGRILIVTGSVLHEDVYKNYDNVIQEALETNVTINVCAVKVPKQLPLQRATDTTDGLYFCTNDTMSLSGDLVDHFLYPTYLIKSPRSHIAVPARCACHGFGNKIGFVCGKCKLVLCKHSPYCDDCRETKQPTGTGAITCKDTYQNGIVLWTKEKPKLIRILETQLARRVQLNNTGNPSARRVHSIVRITNAPDVDLHLTMCGHF